MLKYEFSNILGWPACSGGPLACELRYVELSNHVIYTKRSANLSDTADPAKRSNFNFSIDRVSLLQVSLAYNYRQNSLVRYGVWRQMYRNTNGIVISRVTCRVNNQQNFNKKWILKAKRYRLPSLSMRCSR